MSSLTCSFSYRNFDVTIVGYEIPGGWRLAVELRKGDEVEILRDAESVYPDFASLRSMGIWTAHLAIMKKTTSLE
ncbi:hypothetical protein Herbaro_11430 [Herbaspirillum sp. WKF16]|jgi:hypothetical protein|uniref:hypothetical protein n=1 Tax=Herbaspirillum sp. WKF16 TaxID=3028312 RepID=UPI0023AA15F2|nr:hypothetical protein [Herbaspirillum sp. WKF16]WDZ94112.1 hypothetical protein Herbaro_11430 [Herbaspirillum sp. WKF16]